MCTRSWLAVINDLHVSEGDLDDFDAELEEHLISFLEWLGSRREAAELVINGDFLDFVQAGPYSGAELEDTTDEGVPLCFTESQSLAKLQAIRQAHPRLFTGLRAFLDAQENNRLTILPGNHDADFFWPRVQEQIAEAVCPPGREEQLDVCLGRAYQPKGCHWLWIEHGQQYDPVNWFFVGGEERWSAERPPLFIAQDGRVRLYECTGTRFLIRFLNRLDSRYPYVDNVKPFSRFLRIFGASALVPGWAPLDAAVSVSEMLAYLAKTAVYRKGDLLSIEAADGAPLPHPLAAWVAHASKNERKKLAAAIRERGLRLEVPLDMALDRTAEAERIQHFLAANLDLVEGLGEADPALLGAADGTLTLRSGFKADETEDLYKGAEETARRERVTTVVMGHTHVPVVAREGDFTYFNTGSWTRYYQFADKERTAPWRLLRERSYERFPYQLRYVLVPPGASTATLETWHERSKT